MVKTIKKFKKVKKIKSVLTKCITKITSLLKRWYRKKNFLGTECLLSGHHVLLLRQIAGIVYMYY